MNNGETIKLEFNGKEVEAPAGTTVHRAAEMNEIYIPTLCSHKDLSPYGGCRMCIVEIDGIRGYPLSCNTTATDGMKVLTETVAIREIRREVLQLILSEHPSSCLICGEGEECKEFSTTVRKSGVATGCRWCSNDRQCELQDLVEKLEITEIHYPILYKGYEAERNDPFFDRDYNICILCGRCVRMCQEMRGTSVLSFNHRGTKARVGPAYGRSHIEAGCEFCGACITVCPTGALAEKASKWDGKPDDSVITTCSYCALGCQMEYWRKNGKFSSATPVIDPLVNDGQACVKGRFCVGELAHHFKRGRKPFLLEEGYWKEKKWEEAIDAAAERLKDLKPDEFSMILSPDCTNEDLFAAQKFARSAIQSNSIDCNCRDTLGGGLDLWTRMFHQPHGIDRIHKASRILAVGLDTRFNFSIIGVEIKKAIRDGARMVTIGPRESNLARYCDTWIQSAPGMEGSVLKALVSESDTGTAAEAYGVDADRMNGAADLIRAGEDLTVIIGPAMFQYNNSSDLYEAIDILMGRKETGIIPLYMGANTRGAVEMGAFAELLPGPVPVSGQKKGAPSNKGVLLRDLVEGKTKPKVLYLVGSQPFFERPDCDFLIVQDIIEPDFECDLFLPATAYTESSGTLVNVDGRLQETVRIEELPDSVMFGRARPDWWIFSQIAKKLGADGFGWAGHEDVRKEIASAVPGFPGPGETTREIRPLRLSGGLPKTKTDEKHAVTSNGGFRLALRPMGYTHRGGSITARVEGLGVLKPENGFFINSEDARALGIETGDLITVRAGEVTGTAPARVDPELMRGTVYLYVPETFGGLADRKNLESLYRLKNNPCSVEVTKDEV